MLPGWAFILPWIVFAGWWSVRSRGTARTVEREPIRSRLGYLLLLGGTSFLLVARVPVKTILDRRLLPTWPPLQWLALAITVAGVAFAIWAREHLGRYWSGTVTFKEGHQLIRTGPYRLVRHPIYTGLLFGIVGEALARGDGRGLLAIVLALLGLWRKLTIEERLLGRHFGDEYARYRREVRAIIPFIL
jgi:protein-S-isoprenylcysteine O-methyltransferase Ste14